MEVRKSDIDLKQEIYQIKNNIKGIKITTEKHYGETIVQTIEKQLGTVQIPFVRGMSENG